MKIRPDWRARLADAVDRAGGNRKALSVGAGLNETYLRDTLDKNTKPSLANAEKLSASLGMPLTEWYVDASANELARDGYEIPSRQEMPRDVKVFGVASGGDPQGAFELNMGDTIDYVRRPPRLRGVSDAYALYIVGTSMRPWREEGQIVYVHPRQPVQIGDYVVVQLQPADPGDPQKALIKRLIRRTEKDLKLEQYNPAGEITVPMKRVSQVHRIIDWSELMGI